ncbi:MAG: YaaL family protein [Bacillota bacterium]|nr:YaaL family protein [Bacillota bacterium]
MLAKIWSAVTAQVLPEPEELSDKAEKRVPSLLESVEAARLEWILAKSYFDFVTEPDLIDVAVYNIQAAERKYMYLLKEARNQGLKLAEEQVEKSVDRTQSLIVR